MKGMKNPRVGRKSRKLFEQIRRMTTGQLKSSSCVSPHGQILFVYIPILLTTLTLPSFGQLSLPTLTVIFIF